MINLTQNRKTEQLGTIKFVGLFLAIKYYELFLNIL